MTTDRELALLHLANFNSTNIGNGALVNGLETTISTDFERPVRWMREPWDDYTFGLRDFDQAFVDKVNNSDGLIVGGAVTFNGRDYNTRTGTRFELPHELWVGLRKPLVFYGLSYRHWQGQTYHHLDRFKATIEKILATPNMLLTLRNDGTRRWLKELTGIESNAILDVPDSAVYVAAEEGNAYPELRNGVRNIMVSFNDEDLAHRYDEQFSVPGKLDRSRDHVVGALVSAIERLAERYALNIILVPHYFDDFRMMSSFIERIKPRIAHQNMVSTGLVRVEHTEWFYGRYRQADLAISMRVHSMSPCIGLGTPMVPFTTQDRMTEFLDNIGLADFGVDAFDIAAADRLYEKSCHALDNPEVVRSAFDAARQAMRKQSYDFHRKLADFLAD